MGLLGLTALGTVIVAAIYFRSEIKETLPIIGETGRQIQEFTSTTLSPTINPQVTPRLHPEIGLTVEDPFGLIAAIRDRIRGDYASGDNGNGDNGKTPSICECGAGFTSIPTDQGCECIPNEIENGDKGDTNGGVDVPWWETIPPLWVP